jgi:hypothetical protein
MARGGVSPFVPAITTRKTPCNSYRDGRNKSGHDNWNRQLERKKP